MPSWPSCAVMVSLFVVAPPLSVDNVMAALKRVSKKWRKLGTDLFVPDATLSVIEADFTSDLEQLRGVGS